MPTPFEIPLTSSGQKLSITLGGVEYQLTVKWNPASLCWVVDVADTNGVLIVGGIPLVTGADLLEQFAYLDFGGQLIAQTDHAVDDPPTFDNLGVTGHLYFVTLP